MSSARRHDNQILRAVTIAFALMLALAVALIAGTTDAAAKQISTSVTKAKLPTITKVTPNTGVYVGQPLKIYGKNFVKGKKSLVIIFKRDGSKRSFTARGDASSSTRAIVTAPDVSGDLVRDLQTAGGPLDNMFRLRPITKYGAAKGWTSTTVSPKFVAQSGASIPSDTGPNGDCDKDGTRNGIDADDDNDLLADTIELTIGTDVCYSDTDHDDASDFYEYTVAFQYNGPALPYPGLRPFPNPLVADAGTDFDGDHLTTLGEYRAWQYTGKMSRFYSDADQDSDDDGKIDSAEDEDRDLLPNLVEITGFQAGDPVRDLNWLKPDTDGDGLCDGLDDQDHDGPATPLAVADCAAQVPNNGPGGDPPTTIFTVAPFFDPDPAKIDGDDNKYSNFYEWYIGGYEPSAVGGAYDPCDPDPYPISPYCNNGQPWIPLPAPDYPAP